MDNFEATVDADGKILDFLSGDKLEPVPEEFVRQHYLRLLSLEYHYPKSVLAREVPIQFGSGEMLDTAGNPVCADIVVYANAKACAERDQGKVDLVVECKAPTETTGYNQLVSYIFNTSANGAVWFNGTAKYYRRPGSPTHQLIDWTGIPRRGEAWDSLGRRTKKDLVRPNDVKGLLRLCHNRLHARGIDGDEVDLTMDMVRLILAKAADEEKPSNLPEFHCTPEEYRSREGQQAVADRIQELFKQVVRANTSVFADDERITVGPRAICDVVTELQRYRLLSKLSDSTDWDLMGNAYEQYTATYLKRQQGQFFTNRLVIDFLVGAIDPDYEDVILDPAGGSGGFPTGTMRFIRKKILSRGGTDIAQERQLEQHRTRLFMIEQSKRLVKIAKTAMILNGGSHAGMTQGDSLGPWEALEETIRAHAGRGKPTVILTNPPFGGVGEGKITDRRILGNYACGMKWTERDGRYVPSGEIAEEGVPPEMLFFERCLDWIAPGGKIGIVMPKSFLDTTTYYPARRLLLDRFILLGVVNCHKNTFQPHTGVRTALVLIQRPKTGESLPDDYTIFLGVSREAGQDSEGVPIFKRDEANQPTEVIDHDLDEMLHDFRACHRGQLVPSEYRFSIRRSDINGSLAINPQFYLPNLNKTIQDIGKIDGRNGWTVTTLGQLEKGVLIFKGPRIKTEDLVVDAPGPAVERYYPPNSLLQEKSESAKLIDVRRASPAQLKSIQALRVRHGDLLVTRSGTIGRVTYVTRRLLDAIVSDDMIRIRINNEAIRLYVYAYLQSFAGQDQMLKNEYGAVQQHLEARHVAGIVIPVPPDWADIDSLIGSTRAAIDAREQLEDNLRESCEGTARLLNGLIENTPSKEPE